MIACVLVFIFVSGLQVFKENVDFFLRELYYNYGISGTMTKYQAKAFRSARLDNSLKTKG